MCDSNTHFLWPSAAPSHRIKSLLLLLFKNSWQACWRFFSFFTHSQTRQANNNPTVGADWFSGVLECWMWGQHRPLQGRQRRVTGAVWLRICLHPKNEAGQGRHFLGESTVQSNAWVIQNDKTKDNDRVIQFGWGSFEIAISGRVGWQPKLLQTIPRPN